MNTEQLRKQMQRHRAELPMIFVSIENIKLAYKLKMISFEEALKLMEELNNEYTQRGCDNN